MSIKKIILSATIFILTIGAYNTTFAFNKISFEDFAEWMQENLEIDIINKQAVGMDTTLYNNLKSDFNNANGFIVYKNNNYHYNYGGNYWNSVGYGDIHLILTFQEETNQSYIMLTANNTQLTMGNNNYPLEGNGNQYIATNGDTTMKDYMFDSNTKKYKAKIDLNTANKKIFATTKIENVSTETFFSKDYSNYLIKDMVLCAYNMTIAVKNTLQPVQEAEGPNDWAYSISITDFKETPVPWEVPGGGTIGGDNIIYDYTDESYEYFKKTYFKPYLEFKAPINGYVDYTGNWDRGTTWEIDNTTYKDNEFCLYVYSGDGTVDANLYNGYIYLDVLKAEYTTNIETNKQEIKYKYYDTKKAIPGATYITGEEVSENVMKFTFTLKRCFNDEGETNQDFNTGWLNDLSGDSDYIFILRFEDALFLTTSNTNPFYFNKESPLNKYENNMPVQNPILNGYGYGNGGGFRDSNGQQITDAYDQDLINLNTSSFSKLLESSKQFISNFLGFFDIFPAWLNTLIGLALTVAIVCRVIGR